jgi:hypothetical protein
MGSTHTQLRVAIAAADHAIDHFWSGAWWWQLLRFVSAQHVRVVMRLHGDGSFQVRRATRWWYAMQLASSYWRPVNPPLRKAMREARRRGVSETDLRVLNLNLDLVRKAGRLEVRNARWMPPLAIVASTVMMLAEIESTLQIVILPVGAGIKIAIIVIMTLTYMFLWRGLDLYSARAWETVQRCGPHIRALQLACDSGDVVPIRQQG